VERFAQLVQRDPKAARLLRFATWCEGSGLLPPVATTDRKVVSLRRPRRLNFCRRQPIDPPRSPPTPSHFPRQLAVV
jgi:hypothetical protein